MQLFTHLCISLSTCLSTDSLCICKSTRTEGTIYSYHFVYQSLTSIYTCLCICILSSLYITAPAGLSWQRQFKRMVMMLILSGDCFLSRFGPWKSYRFGHNQKVWCETFQDLDLPWPSSAKALFQTIEPCLFPTATYPYHRAQISTKELPPERLRSKNLKHSALAADRNYTTKGCLEIKSTTSILRTLKQSSKRCQPKSWYWNLKRDVLRELRRDAERARERAGAEQTQLLFLKNSHYTMSLKLLPRACPGTTGSTVTLCYWPGSHPYSRWLTGNLHV